MVTLSREEIQECYDFAVEAVNGDYQQEQDFGVGNNARTLDASIADKVSGKMGEYLFKNALEKTKANLQVELDFEHREGHHNLDNGDARILVAGVEIGSDYKIDIKTSTAGSKWLLVEESKFEENGIYVFVKFNKDMPKNNIIRENPEQLLDLEEIKGEIVGWAFASDFYCERNNEIYFEYEKDASPINDYYVPKNFRQFDPDEVQKQINQHFENAKNHAERNNYTVKKLYLNTILKARKNYGLPCFALRKIDTLLDTLKK